MKAVTLLSKMATLVEPYRTVDHVEDLASEELVKELV
jgi:hypothetical protein